MLADPGAREKKLLDRQRHIREAHVVDQAVKKMPFFQAARTDDQRRSAALAPDGIWNHQN